MLELNGISPRRQEFNRRVVSTVDRLVSFIVDHWLALANGAMFLFVFLSGLAPFLMSVGLTLPGRALYLFFKAFCHDIPDRHYSIFGYRMTLDHRSLAIYLAMLGFGLFFAFARGRLRPLNWRLYILLAVPMAVDGFTQLFGLRESTWELRTVTGALFGAGTAWLFFPHVEMGMRDARRSMRRDGLVIHPTEQGPVTDGSGEWSGKLGR